MLRKRQCVLLLEIQISTEWCAHYWHGFFSEFCLVCAVPPQAPSVIRFLELRPKRKPILIHLQYQYNEVDLLFCILYFSTLVVKACCMQLKKPPTLYSKGLKLKLPGVHQPGWTVYTHSYIHSAAEELTPSSPSYWFSNIKPLEIVFLDTVSHTLKRNGLYVWLCLFLSAPWLWWSDTLHCNIRQ